jgi:hypothetical protein
LTLDEIQAMQKQGVLPGFELGAASTILQPAAKEEAQKELKGNQLSLFDDTGLPTKVAEKAKTKGDKAEANRLRQLQQQQAAGLKESQAKLKKFLAAKQSELDLKEAPPFAGVAVEGQPDLFGQSSAAVLAEPTVVTKPVKLTPKQVATRINDEVLGALGIGSTALIRKNKLLEGKDISNPADAAEVKRILEAYADRKNLSTSIREKIEEYLNRPEFQAQEVLSEPISEPARPVGGAVQPSFPSDQQQLSLARTPETLAGPVGGGLDVTESVAVPPVGGEGAVSGALSRKEQNDLAKAEARMQPAIDEENQFIANVDNRILDLMGRDIVNTEGLEDTDAFKLLRIAPLTQEYVRLKEVTAQIADAKQRQKNLRQLELIRGALAKSSPDAVVLADRQTGDTLADFTNRVNQMARDELAAETEARAVAPVTQETMATQEREDTQAMQSELDEMRTDEEVKKAAEILSFSEFVSKLAKESSDPDLKFILDKIKRMGLKTKITIGKVKRKPGSMNVYDFGEFDPATNTITI